MDTNQTIHEITELFVRFSTIPHPSGQEQALAAHLADLLRSWGGAVELDDHWNLRCDFPAAAGLESTPLVCIQGHLDMVYVTEPKEVRCQVQGDWLTSDGQTALGASGLLSVTAALWLLRQPFPHGPVRVLLTTGGEWDMTGARGMDPDWLDGVRYLIGACGFQSEHLTIGSSGGCYQIWRRTLKTIPTQEQGWLVKLSRFPGGHSAMDLGKGRVNPLRLLAMLLIQSNDKIVTLSGGSSINAIPSDASAVVIPENPNIFVHWQALAQSLGGWLDYTPSTAPASIWSPIDQQAALDFFLSLPSSITAYLPDQPELPACSGNLGRMDHTDHTLTYHVLLRGTPQQALDRSASGCVLLADRCGFDLASTTSYPVWEGDPNNPLAQRMSRLWQARTGTPMEIGAVHAGSELSVLTQMRPELTAVGTGITIENPHTLQEQAKLDDLPAYVQLLRDTLEDIAQKG